MKKVSRSKFFAAGAVGVVLALTACSSSSGGSDAAAGVGGASAAAVPGVPTLAELYQGTGGQPPESSPAPAKGKSVWWVSCGQSIPACAAVANGAQAAATALGWDFHVVDGNQSTAGASAAAYRTAIAAKADAIVNMGIDCPTIQQPLEEAKAAGVALMAYQSLDCSFTGGPELFNVPMAYTPDAMNTADFWLEFGKTSADYIINKSGGKAKIIDNAGDSPLYKQLDKGFRDEIAAKCPGCEIVATAAYTGSTLIPNGSWIQNFRSALVKHPDANATFAPWDFMWASLGGAQAVKESGLKLTVFGGTGTSDAVDLVRNGQVTAVTDSYDHSWAGWAAMDNLNRFFGNQPAVAQGQGFATVDSGNNLPATGKDYVTKVDYASAYKKIWEEAAAK